MRWRRMIAAALAVMLMVQLCPIPTAWAQNTEPYLRVDAGLGTGLVATMTGGRGMDVNISSNTRWEIQVAEGADWIGLSLTGGSGDGTFYTVIAENTTGQPREGLICIQAEGCEPIWIKVYQGQTGEQQNLAGKFDLNRFAVNNDFAVYCTPEGKVEATVDEYVAQRREEYAAFKGMYGLTCTEEEYVNEYEEISLHEDYSRIRQLNDVIGVSTTSYGSSDYALLRANGTVELNQGAQSLMEYLLGYETTEYCNWRNIKQVELGSGILLGLREDGRVDSICWDMTFDTPRTQPIGTHPSQWEDVVQIAADEACFGLKRNGTVYYYGQGIG
ncbi:MAG: BACON domain-containing protein, partial [Candidatus Spyradocola sp.]